MRILVDVQFLYVVFPLVGLMFYQFIFYLFVEYVDSSCCFSGYSVYLSFLMCHISLSTLCVPVGYSFSVGL